MNWLAEARSRLPSLLGRWLKRDVEVAGADDADLEIRAGSLRFPVVVRGAADIATLERALAALPTGGNDRVPVVVVPYMGPSARAWAEGRGGAWIDLSGNADVRAGDLALVVTGQPNRYALRGRPSHPFTPAYSRVSRALLVESDRWWRQIELARAVGLAQGTVSKAVQRLDAMELLERDPSGALRARAPSLLLDAWAQHHRFDDHAIYRFHQVARSGPEALDDLATGLANTGIRWAATGLSAAWLHTRFADFRLNTLYVAELPQRPADLGLREVEQGENTWLVVPRDEGVFHGVEPQPIARVHPVQCYLDLLGHPERADDAARELRERHLTWRA